MNPLAALAIGYLALRRERPGVGGGYDWRKQPQDYRRKVTRGLRTPSASEFSQAHGGVISPGLARSGLSQTKQPGGAAAYDAPGQGQQASYGMDDGYKDPSKPGFVWMNEPSGHWERIRADGANDPDSPNYQGGPDGNPAGNPHDPTQWDPGYYQQQYGGGAYPGYGATYGGGYGNFPPQYDDGGYGADVYSQFAPYGEDDLSQDSLQLYSQWMAQNT